MIFSIIVPVYNVAPYLRECLDSLAAQTFPHWEAICVDDGSTDGSGAILDAYAAKDNRFKILHQANAGVGAARNKALAAAKGERLLFVDADDYISPSMLAAVSGTIAADASGAGAIVFREAKVAGGERPRWTAGSSTCMVDISETLPSFLAGVRITMAAFRRDLVSDLRFAPYPLGEDWIWLAEAFGRIDRIVSIDAVLYAYRQHPTSAVRKPMDAARLALFIDYHERMFEAVAATGKKPGAAFARTRGNGWIEECPARICALKGCGAKAVWARWFDSMARAKDMPFFSRWQRFAARFAAATRSRIVAFVFCILPHKLKKAGLHRR